MFQVNFSYVANDEEARLSGEGYFRPPPQRKCEEEIEKIKDKDRLKMIGKRDW